MNCAFEDDETDDDVRSLVSIWSQREDGTNMIGFTPDQHRAILAMLQNTEKQISQPINNSS